MTSDHQLLVGRNDPRGHTARPRADAPGARVLARATALEHTQGCIATTPLAQRAAVLADPRGEHDGIDPAERGGERAQLASNAVDEEIDRDLGIRLAARFERAHVAGDTGN